MPLYIVVFAAFSYESALHFYTFLLLPTIIFPITKTFLQFSSYYQFVTKLLYNTACEPNVYNKITAVFSVIIISLQIV